MLTDEARAWIGKDLGSRTFQVSRADIAKFAAAVGYEEAQYFDPEVARAVGHRDVVAPPSFYMSLSGQLSNLVPRSKLGANGMPIDQMPILPLARAMGGESEVRLSAAIQAGDVITVSQRVANIYEKEGRNGTLVFIVFERRFVNEAGGLVAEETYTRIVR